MNVKHYLNGFLFFLFINPIWALTAEYTASQQSHPRALYYSEPVYFTINYQSDEPIRVKVLGEKNGYVITTGLIAVPFLVYPAGIHTLRTWLAYKNETDIDTVQIIFFNFHGTALSIKKLPMVLQWNKQPLPHDAQKHWWQHLGQARLDKPEHQSLSWVIFKQLIVLIIPTYLFFQIKYLCTWTGIWRRKAANPLVITIPLAILSWFAVLINSTWWPFLLGIACPFALLYLLVLSAKKRRQMK